MGALKLQIKIFIIFLWRTEHFFTNWSPSGIRAQSPNEPMICSWFLSFGTWRCDMVLTSVAFYGNVSTNGGLQDLHQHSSLPAAAGRDAGDYGHRSKVGPPPCFFGWPLEGGGGHRPSHPRSTSSDTRVIIWIIPKFWDVISILTRPSFHLLMLICHRRKGNIHCSLLSFLDGRALADEMMWSPQKWPKLVRCK